MRGVEGDEDNMVEMKGHAGRASDNYDVIASERREEGYSSEGSEGSRSEGDLFAGEGGAVLSGAGGGLRMLSIVPGSYELDVETDGEVLDGGLLRNKRSRGRGAVPATHENSREIQAQWGTDTYACIDVSVGSPHDSSLMRIKHLRYLGSR